MLIPIFTLESKIKRELRTHLKELGFERDKDGALNPGNNEKETYRLLHKHQRLWKLSQEKKFIQENYACLLPNFANGNEIDVERIEPRLEIISSGTWQSDLFRFASLTWSVPVSQGFGRRMRFLVWDDYHKKLIGLFALGDPVYNLRVRDEYIGWDVETHRQNLINIMDAYVLGAVAPYNMLLGGKMIACLIRSKEIRKYFNERYGHKESIIAGYCKKPLLTCVTTSSALGRSSIYNRLILDGKKYFQSLGFSSGFGHFHIPQSLFEEIREYLRLKDHKYSANNRFGDGPNWRLRAIRQALKLMGLNENLLRHGIKREVFICELASNTKKYLNGEHKRLNYDDLLSVDEISELAKERWLIPRAKRMDNYKLFNRNEILALLQTEDLSQKVIDSRDVSQL